jgi:shikimate kinase
MFSVGTSTLSQNLILTGYLGPSQLQIARMTAESLKMRLVDFEARLEANAGQPGAEIRELYGEMRLKTLEDELLTEITLYRGALLLLSSGTLLRGAFDQLRANGVILVATASVDAVLQRLHIAMGARFHDPRERQFALAMIKREWAIRGHEGVIEVDTSGMNDAQMVEALITRWREAASVIDWRGA